MAQDKAGRLYFRQLLAGRDVARGDEAAGQLLNYIYLVGDRERGKAVAVDVAYDVDGVLDILEAEGMELDGVLVTHHHADHVGGITGRWEIEGLAELLGRSSVPVHAHRDEVAALLAATGLSAGDVQAHDSEDTLAVGDIPIFMLHTPGHTPGSQCFLVDGKLVSGDTLFLEGCGRTDLPHGDAAAMYNSLRYLSSLPDDTVICPGHRYSVGSDASMGAVKRVNGALEPMDIDEWLALFAPAPFHFSD